jgi:polysaccharide biosynthesis/export protein
MTMGLFLFLACTSSQRPPNVADLEVSVALPPADAFTFGPGDVLSIWVWRHDDLSVDVTVAPDGYITYPLVGRLEVAGHTYEDLVQTLQSAVDDYYVDAKVAVNIKEVVSQKVLVIGEVQTPSVYPITNELSLLEVLTYAGGINPDARTDNVLIVRGGIENPMRFTVDVRSIYGQGDMSQMVYLQRGDIVYVPATTITNVERFFRKFQGILAPILGASAVYRNMTTGGAQGTSSVLE